MYIGNKNVVSHCNILLSLTVLSVFVHDKPNDKNFEDTHGIIMKYATNPNASGLYDAF